MRGNSRHQPSGAGTADKAEFEMTAKTATGAVTTGSATLVKEGGAWKIDDEAWATPQ